MTNAKLVLMLCMNLYSKEPNKLEQITSTHSCLIHNALALGENGFEKDAKELEEPIKAYDKLFDKEVKRILER